MAGVQIIMMMKLGDQNSTTSLLNPEQLGTD